VRTRCPDTTFSVSIVRYTAANTTVLDHRLGDAVNIETDIMMR